MSQPPPIPNRSRQPDWLAPDSPLGMVERRESPKSGEQASAFARHYRNLCAALADAEQRALPEPVLDYLHHRVAKGHAYLYRLMPKDLPRWRELHYHAWCRVPEQLIRDRCFHVALAMFWLPFILCAALAAGNSDMAEAMLGSGVIQNLHEMYREPPSGAFGERMTMSSFYIWNNVSLALQCFAYGIFVGIGSAFCLLFNGAFLGTVFGYMGTSPYAGNFFNFVTAHGPFELIGICVAGGAGLKLGWSVVATNGKTRLQSLRDTAREATPMIVVACVLITLAAGIEGFWSPATIPYELKAAVGIVSTVILILYFSPLARGSARHEP